MLLYVWEFRSLLEGVFMMTIQLSGVYVLKLRNPEAVSPQSPPPPPAEQNAHNQADPNNKTLKGPETLIIP